METTPGFSGAAPKPHRLARGYDCQTERFNHLSTGPQRPTSSTDTDAATSSENESLWWKHIVNPR